MERPFEPFAVEQFMSENEQRVELVFAESGVHPMSAKELLEGDNTKRDTILDTLLDYPEVNGLVALRRRIAALYGCDDPDHVLVTVGASEANYILAQCLVRHEGDVVAVLAPTYKQFAGDAKNIGANVREFFLSTENGWKLDLDSLKAAVTPDTKVVALVNPNNPTGHVLGEDERAAITEAARAVGAWLLVDEVYAGAETTGDAETPSFYGSYDKVVCVNSMSKAYGLPGLRIGWAIGPKELIQQAWRHHEYATISGSMLGNHLALHALSPEVRPRLTSRARGLIRRGWPILQQVVDENSDLLSVTFPGASAMCFVRYKLKIGSRALALRLIEEQKMLVVPGEAFAQEHHLRFTYALPEERVREGLRRLVETLRAVEQEERASA